MSDLRELYQSVILDHNKHPRNFREPEGANRVAEGFNPLCGDELKVFLTVDDERVADAGFTGSGCAICKASASLMTEGIKGKSVADVEQLFDGFHGLVTSDPGAEPNTRGLGKLAVFSGVREFPIRIKCATLAWHAMRSALQGDGTTISTE